MNMVGGSFFLIFFVLIALVLVMYIFWLLSMQNTLKAIHPSRQAMPPQNVWLNLIPLFNIVWQFITVSRVAESIASEYIARGWQLKDPRPTKTIGILSLILGLVGRFIPVIGTFILLGSLVTWIVHWVQVVNYKNELLKMVPPDVVDHHNVNSAHNQPDFHTPGGWRPEGYQHTAPSGAPANAPQAAPSYPNQAPPVVNTPPAPPEQPAFVPDQGTEDASYTEVDAPPKEGESDSPAADIPPEKPIG